MNDQIKQLDYDLDSCEVLIRRANEDLLHDGSAQARLDTASKQKNECLEKKRILIRNRDIADLQAHLKRAVAKVDAEVADRLANDWLKEEQVKTDLEKERKAFEDAKAERIEKAQRAEDQLSDEVRQENETLDRHGNLGESKDARKKSIADAKAAITQAQEKIAVCETAMFKLRGQTFENSAPYKEIQMKIDLVRVDREKIQTWKTMQLGNLNREYEVELAKRNK